MSISDAYIEIIILYSIIFIVCVICCIKFYYQYKYKYNNNDEIPIPVLPMPTIHEGVELTEIVEIVEIPTPILPTIHEVVELTEIDITKYDEIQIIEEEEIEI